MLSVWIGYLGIERELFVMRKLFTFLITVKLWLFVENEVELDSVLYHALKQRST